MMHVIACGTLRDRMYSVGEARWGPRKIGFFSMMEESLAASTAELHKSTN